MTERPSGQGRADDWARGYSGEQYSGEQYSGQPYSGDPYYAAGSAGQGMPGQGMPGPGTAGPGMPTSQFQPAMPRQAADSRGFLSALFDFSFTSFVTVKVIKVIYVLVLALVSLQALVVTIVMFKVGSVAGLATLLIGDPLFIIIAMALCRLILESFVVVFRIAEDTRAIRERGENASR